MSVCTPLTTVTPVAPVIASTRSKIDIIHDKYRDVVNEAEKLCNRAQEDYDAVCKTDPTKLLMMQAGRLSQADLRKCAAYKEFQARKEAAEETLKATSKIYRSIYWEYRYAERDAHWQEIHPLIKVCYNITCPCRVWM